MASSTSATAPTASTSKPTSKRFTEIYAGLSPEVQRAFVEKHLALLLDDLPQNIQQSILDTAEETKTIHAHMPDLDFANRCRELDNLFSLRDDDAKRVMAKEPSIRENITEEVVQHVASWLSDIWSVAYEHKAGFALAHKCLVRAAKALEQAQNFDSSCRCFVDNLYVDVVIRRRKTFKTVRAFQLTGIRSLERVVLWVWRDLFLTMLASDEANTQLIPDMLEDIKVVRGWSAVHRILSGGRGISLGDDDDEEDDDEEDDEDGDGEKDDGEDEEDEQETVVEDDDDDAWSDDMPPLESLPESFAHRHSSTLPVSAPHWPPILSAQVPNLRRIVLDYLLTVFESAPELTLYQTINDISRSPLTRTKMLDSLESVALTSADSFVASLDIYADEDMLDRLWRIIQAGSHLLRPRDYAPYQRAVAVLSRSRSHRVHALTIATKEIIDTARSIRASLLPSFSRIDDPARTKELTSLLRTGLNALSRQDRIDTWIDNISTPGSSFPHPFSLAAMMMGLPIPPLSAEETSDAFGMLDLDRDDADMIDLREDLRPNMKDRFDSWVETLAKLGKTTEVLAKVYLAIVKIMPFLAAADVVEAMMNRLSDRPTKQHVGEGLEALNAFAKVQRRKAAAVAKVKKAQEEKAAQEAKVQEANGNAQGAKGKAQETKTRNVVPSAPAAGPSGTQPQSRAPPAFKYVPYLASTFNGIDDVD